MIKFYEENVDKMYLFDMNKMIKYSPPNDSLSSESDNIWSSDGIHLSPFGYEKMAQCIFNVLQPWLKQFV